MNRDIKTILQCAVVIGLFVFLVNQCAKADDLDITQHLYDQAIFEIENGNKGLGCRILQDALKTSEDVNDGFETYNQIWAIGTQACNWINNPSTVETSAPKQ